LPIYCQLRQARLHCLFIAASRYVYDWLVALYTLANENAGYRHPQDVTDVDREQLIALIA
ncbi:hypothetical protein, partial [Salmonella enterica]|uniref:hypothetical protein n=1 Tax=Salmonella enterica TaxID=28901 RepID=UPI0011188F1E